MTNSPVPRALLAQGIIGLSLCLGGYAALVNPLKARLATARQELAQAAAAAQQARLVEGSMAAVMDRLAATKDQAEAIEHAGAVARSQELLYAAVSTRAADLGVLVEEFSPIDPGHGASIAGRPGDVILRCSLVATGSYGDLAMLLRTLGDDCGFASVRAVRLSPEGDSRGPMVHAEIQTEHYAVDASPLAEPAPGEGNR
jgi:hypothetical protein